MRFDEADAARLMATSERNRASKQKAPAKIATDPVETADAAFQPMSTPAERKSLKSALAKSQGRYRASASSKLEEEFAAQVAVAGLPTPVREYRFHPVRKWRFDFAWPAEKLALEVEGGLYGKGRHNTMVGINGDCEKYNTALCMGWRVLRVTDRHIKSGEALEWVKEAL